MDFPTLKLFLFILTLSFIPSAVDGLSKKTVLTHATIRLVRKDWRPDHFHPGTDEPLFGFPGNFSDLQRIMVKLKHFKYVARPLLRAVELFDDPQYNSSQPSVIITHPLTIGDSAFIKFTVAVMAGRNLQKHYNIFAVHAPWLSLHIQLTCFQTIAGIKTDFQPMAEGFSSFLIQGIKAGKIRADQISFIGFSYAGTVNGYMARIIKRETGDLTHTILSLDAFAHNYDNIYFEQISAADAHFVHIIHSSSALGGTFRRIATVDVVINNGYLQPGCESPLQQVGCSHRRSVAVFLYALLVSGNVMARKCETWKRFQECQCTDEAGYPVMEVSFPVNQEARGTFFVRTSEKIPYAISWFGTYCADPDRDEELPLIRRRNY